MRTYYRCTALAAAATALLASGASAQQAPTSPHIGYVFPPGAQQGTTVKAIVGGQFLLGANSALVSGDGVRAAVGGYDRPMNQRQVLLLRDKLEEAQKRIGGPAPGAIQRGGLANLAAFRRLAKEAGITDDEIRKLQEFQRSRNDPKKQPNLQIEEKVSLTIEVVANAAPGPREIRLVTTTGLTNPICFCVGTISEATESEPNEKLPDIALGDSLPGVVNGQIMPGDVDRFAFSARKGQTIVARVQARSLIPYLADAVPGWFQATLALTDDKGREVAYADDYRFLPDPVLVCSIPADGRYVVEIKDSVYRGREDFVYRLSVGELPFITSTYPLGAREQTPTRVLLTGWNLPGSTTAAGRCSVTVDRRSSGTYPITVSNRGMISNEAPFAVGGLPDTTEKEPNDTGAKAMVLALPVVANGRIDKPGDRDVYTVRGRAGQTIVAEVTARRLGSPLDSTLSLLDANGKQIAFNDDHVDKGAGLITHHADSLLTAKPPKDGIYYVVVEDTQRRGGPEYGYRLRVSAPMPDFELRVVPASLGARAGASVPITIYALRRDGFEGDIALSLVDAPRGFTISGGWVPAGQESVRATLTVPQFSAAAAVPLKLEGRAQAGGREIRREAIPAEDMMQAFAYRHLVPSERWLVRVAGRGGVTASLRRPGAARIPVGGTAAVPVAMPGRAFIGTPVLALSDPPTGLSIDKVEDTPSGVTVVLRADAKAKAGAKGNLIIEAFREFTPPAADGKPGRAKRRVPVGTLPAIPYEIVAGT